MFASEDYRRLDGCRAVRLARRIGKKRRCRHIEQAERGQFLIPKLAKVVQVIDTDSVRPCEID